MFPARLVSFLDAHGVPKFLPAYTVFLPLKTQTPGGSLPAPL